MRPLYFCSFLIVMSFGCNQPQGDIIFEESDPQYAIPLVNSRLDLETLTSVADGSSISVDENVFVTALYRGEVNQRSATEIFAAVDTMYSIPVLPNVNFPLPTPTTGDEVRRAVFADSEVWFTFSNNQSVPATVSVTFNQFSKDGAPFVVTFTAPPNQTIVSERTSLRGVSVATPDNNISFGVSITDAQGNQLPFSIPLLTLNRFDLDYVEGTFEERIFDLDGDIITVGIFDNWISGGIRFQDPKLVVDVENGFGLPVSSLFNNMTITTVSGQQLNIESSIIDKGVQVDYPRLNEVGTAKKTRFEFDKNNSNIVELFNERAARVFYDIDARVNPDNPDLVGFIDRNSFFKIDVAVEIPLEGTINDFVLETTEDLDSGPFEDLATAEFKIIFENDFPIDMITQIFFENENGMVLEELFDQPIKIPAGTPTNGVVTEAGRLEIKVPFSAERMDLVRSATKIRVNSRFDTPADLESTPLKIFDDYGLIFKMGAIVTLQ